MEWFQIFARKPAAFVAAFSLLVSSTLQAQGDGCRLGPNVTSYAHAWFKMVDDGGKEVYPIIGNAFVIHARPIRTCDQQNAKCIPWGKAGVGSAAELQKIEPSRFNEYQPWLVQFATAAHVIVEVCERAKLNVPATVELRVVKSYRAPQSATIAVPIDARWCKQHQVAAKQRYDASRQQEGVGSLEEDCGDVVGPDAVDTYLFSQVIAVLKGQPVVGLAVVPLPKQKGENTQSGRIRVPGFRPFTYEGDVRLKADGIFFSPGSNTQKLDLTCVRQSYSVKDQPAPYGSSGSPVLVVGPSGTDAGVVGIVIQEGAKSLEVSRAEAELVYPAFQARNVSSDLVGEKDVDPRIQTYMQQGTAARSARFVPLLRQPATLLEAMREFDLQLAQLSGEKLPPTYFTMSYMWNVLLDIAAKKDTVDLELLSDASRFMSPLERVARLDQVFRSVYDSKQKAGLSPEDAKDVADSVLSGVVYAREQLEPRTDR